MEHINNKGKKVMIGMSGGVDSSVAAALLVEQGYDVTGVTLKLWDAGDEDGLGISKDSTCCSLDDINDARQVAYKLKIPHYVLNFKDVFNTSVVDYFVKEYQEGKTPNPCIACNKYIKMGGMLEKALAMGFDYIATGHYARIIHNSDSGRYELHRGLSGNKDQSYVLYNFTQRQLKHTLMPLGEFVKDDVREMASKYNLRVASKPDSQEICFVTDNNYGSFVEDYTKNPGIAGYYIDKEGNILGKHKGIYNYTIGQRKGLGIALGKRVFVTNIDPINNTVQLGDEKDLLSNELIARDVNFISMPELNEEIKVKAKIRYNFNAAQARLIPHSNNLVKVVFDEPVRAITPGQAVVFYQDDNVLGGGTII